MAKRIESTPKADGFRMPGEFEEQKQIWMLWPERPDNWRLGGKPAQKVFSEVASAIAEFEPVTVLVNEDQYKNFCQGIDPGHLCIQTFHNSNKKSNLKKNC